MSSKRFGILLVVAILMMVGCKSRSVTGSANARGMDLAKVIAKANENRLHFQIMTLKGKADVEDVSKGSKIGFTYRIDIAKDSLILINVSKFGIPMMNMRIGQDTVLMRMPINQTAMVCDFGLLQKVAKMDLDFAKLQALLLGEATLEQPITLVSTKGNSIELEGNRPPYSVYWILNSSHFRLEKMRIQDITLGKESVLTYSDFKKVGSQIVASSMVLEATQAQSVRIELHHSGIAFDQEKVNFRFRIPESYKIIPCDSLP